MSQGLYTKQEIASQPEVWAQTIQKFMSQQKHFETQLETLLTRPAILTGCGSTYYLSMYVASLLQKVGGVNWVSPASELYFSAKEMLPPDYTLITTSRSGTTTETLWEMQAYRETFGKSAQIISITCVPETPMVENSDLVFLSEFGQETSVVQTRSFTSMAIMAQIMAAFTAKDQAWLKRLQDLPQFLERVFTETDALSESLGNDLSIDRIFFLGNGPYYGIASEAALKMKEMTRSWTEVYHTLEFRHGPMSVVTPNALVVGFISDFAAEAELKVLSDMKKLGAHTLIICDQASTFDLTGIDHVVEIKSGLNDWERAILYLPFLQKMAFHRALAKGLNPDEPVNLSQVVTLT